MFNFIILTSKLMFFLLLTLNIIPATGYAAEKFIVRVIYFKPQGAAPINHAKYDKIIKDMQEFFRTEMIRHNYGDKTFKIETDHRGDLIIHKVNGKHPGDHYKGGTFDVYYEKISKEIPFEINNTTNRKAQDDIYIVIIGGVEILWGDGIGHPWGNAWTFPNALGGTAIVNENFEKLYPDNYTSIIYHEFGHTFHLQHTNLTDSLMGFLPFGGPKYITDFEAQLLNETHFFNDDHILNASPQIVGDLQLKAIGENTVRFEVNVQGNADLYHCQISRDLDYVGSVRLKNREDLAKIDVPRRLLPDDQHTFDVLVIDVNGNKSIRKFSNLKIPEPELAGVSELAGDGESKLKYLTIRDGHPDSLIPINNQQEWCGWENAGTFEKIPNGPSPKLPNWYIHVPKLDEWDSWFYSHAISRFVYDVSGGEYNRFDAHFYLPNPCNGNADVEVVCLADGVEIYRSEILRSPAAQNKHFQIDFPKDTKEFTIEITDAGDGIGCDHFVFGEAKILLLNDDANPDVNEIKDEDPDDVICEHCIPDTDIEINVVPDEDLGINPEHKLTTKWATIKAR